MEFDKSELSGILVQVLLAAAIAGGTVLLQYLKSQQSVSPSFPADLTKVMPL
jgi:hypothetical protein